MAEKSPILQAIKQICDEKNLSEEVVLATIEAALASAYRKDFGEKNQNIKVKYSPEDNTSEIFDVKLVVEDEPILTEEELLAKEKEAEAGDQIGEDGEIIHRFNPRTEIHFTDAKLIKHGAKLGEEIWTKLPEPEAYGRVAAQTAKQVIIQKLREAERENVFEEYKDKESEIVNGTVQRVEGRVVFIDLGKVIAKLLPNEQSPNEHYVTGQRIKVYVVSVNYGNKGPEVIVSRSHPQLVAKLFAMEVPEIQNGAVEIKAIAREAGSRTKMAVTSKEENIDPIGACVGQQGSRVQTVISEIGGEKIDIIEWNENPEVFISHALSPAKVISVELNEAERQAVVEVKEDQLSLAIGKSGQNVRLAAKLSGWRVDIVSSDNSQESVSQVVEEIKKAKKKKGAEEKVEEEDLGEEETKE